MSTRRYICSIILGYINFRSSLIVDTNVDRSSPQRSEITRPAYASLLALESILGRSFGEVRRFVQAPCAILEEPAKLISEEHAADF